MKNRLLFLVIFLLLLAGAAYIGYTNGFFDSFLSPAQKLNKALEKTASVDSIYAKYEMNGTTKLTDVASGVSQSIPYIAKGYITGTTDGELSQAEMAISSPNNPTSAVNVEFITTENNGSYVKGALTEGRWMHFTEEEWEDFNEGPSDASLYPIAFLDSFLTTDRALTRAIDSSSIQYLKDEKVRDKNVRVYTVDISIPDYIQYLSENEDNAESDIDDAKKILAKAIMDATVRVDKESGYVSGLTIQTENLTQILTKEQIKEFGFTTEHDVDIDVTFSRFGLSTNIEEPMDYVEYADMVGSEEEEKVLGVFAN